jgi:hypothetical protein
VRDIVTARILAEAKLEAQVGRALKQINRPTSAELAKGIRAAFAARPENEWRTHLDIIVKKRSRNV